MFEFGHKLENGATVVHCTVEHVLAHWRDEWVTWAIDNKGNTFWGHYFDDFFAAARDHKERANISMKILDKYTI